MTDSTDETYSTSGGESLAEAALRPGQYFRPTVLIRIVAVSHVLAALVGLFLGLSPLAKDLTSGSPSAPAVLYSSIVLIAGFLLWFGFKAGWILSLVLNCMQVITIFSASLVWRFASGLSLMVGIETWSQFSSWSVGFHCNLATGFIFFINFPADPAFYVDLFAAAAICILLRVRPKGVKSVRRETARPPMPQKPSFGPSAGSPFGAGDDS